VATFRENERGLFEIVEAAATSDTYVENTLAYGLLAHVFEENASAFCSDTDVQSASAYFSSLPEYNAKLHESELRLTGAEPAAYQLSATFKERYADYLKLHHDCLHASDDRLRSVIDNKLVAGLKDVRFPPAGFTCRICLLAKTVAKKYAQVAPEHHKATRLGQAMHFDHWHGPTDIPGLPLGYTGALVGEEEFSEFGFFEPTQTKEQDAALMMMLVGMLDKREHADGGVESIFIDHGKELLTAEVKAWCAANKLRLPGSAYYAHSSHGKIERLNLIIGNALRCALLEEGVLPQEWPWILILAMRIRNSLPTRNHPLTTPWELYFKRKPTSSAFHRFKAPVVILALPAPPKSQPRGIQGRFIGMAGNSETVYRIQVQTRSDSGELGTRIVFSRDVWFEYEDKLDANWDVEFNGAHNNVLDSDLPPVLLDGHGRPMHDGANSDVCAKCKVGGNLTMCDYCTESWHLKCLGRKKELKAKHFRCPECVARATEVGPDATDHPATSGPMAADKGAASATPLAQVASPKPIVAPLVPSSVLANAARDRRAAARDAVTARPASATTVLASFPLSAAARARQANAAWKTVTDGNGELAKEAKSMRTAARTAARTPALPAATEPPRVKFIQTGNACVDRTAAYEPLPLRHAERKAEARAIELAARGQSQQREDLRLKQQRHDIYAFNAQLNMDRRSLAVGKKVNTEKLRDLFDVFSVQEQPPEEPHWTNTPSIDQEEQCEDESSIPAWLAKIGSLYVPLGGSTSTDGIWILATAADLGKDCNAKSVPLPQHYNQARVSQLWTVWERAIAAELAQLKAKNAWTEVDHSSAADQILLGTTWVFTCKDSTDPTTGKHCLKFKARLTVRGDQQKAADINENHRASPTADLDMLRLLMATVAGDPRTEYLQFDFVGAYLNSTFATDQQPVFIRVPAGYVPSSKMPVVLRLNIYLYGLVESAYQWYQTIAATLKEQGWTVGSYDCCLWRREGPEGPTYLILHVDDGMMVGNDTEKLFKRLAAVYEIKHLGRPHMFLGIQFEFLPEGQVFLHQRDYIRELLKFWEDHALHAMPTKHNQRKQHTPLHVSLELRNLDGLPTVDEEWYHILIGQLNWLQQTRPDLANAILHLARGIKQQTPLHGRAAHCLLLYLRDHDDWGCLYGATPHLHEALEAWMDAEHGANKATGRADGGHVIFCKGGPVSWQSKAQGCVTDSTFGSEMVELSRGAKKICKLRNYQADLGRPATAPANTYVDNHALDSYSHSVGLSRAARQYLLAYHFGREKHMDGTLRVRKCSGKDNKADMHTKTLAATAFQRGRERHAMYSLAALRARSRAT
jgi:hypothetical protein